VNRTTRALVVASTLVCGAILASSAEADENLLAAKLEVASWSAKQNAVALTAWKTRDARLFMSTIPRDFRVTRPDGSVMTWESLLSRTEHQMAAVPHVDHFIVTIAVESVAPESALVVATQDWMRVVKGSDGKATRFKTGVTHRERWKRADGQWRMEGFTEHDQTREEISDSSIGTREEQYEIRVSLTDRVATRP
jgi:hypothetical protein